MNTLENISEIRNFNCKVYNDKFIYVNNQKVEINETEKEFLPLLQSEFFGYNSNSEKQVQSIESRFVGEFELNGKRGLIFRNEKGGNFCLYFSGKVNVVSNSKVIELMKEDKLKTSVSITFEADGFSVGGKHQTYGGNI